MNRYLLPPTKIAAIAVASAFAITGFLVALDAGGFLEGLELRQYDRATATLADASQASDVVLVTISDDELARWGWPLSDDRLAAVIEAVLDAGARVAGVDIYRETPVGPGAERLRTAFAAPQVIGIFKLGEAGGVVIGPPPATTDGDRFGFSDMPVDQDGVARRALLLVNTDAGLRLSLAMRMSQVMLGENGLRPWPDDPRVLMFGAVPVPPLADGFGPYRGLDATGYQVVTRHRHARPSKPVLPAGELIERGDPDGLLRDKAVLIGMASTSVKDYFTTPLNQRTGADFSFGLEVHAAVLQQLLDHARGVLRPMQSPSRAGQIGMVGLAALGGAAAAAVSGGMVAAALLGLGGATLAALALSAALQAGLMLPAATVFLAWLGSFGLAYTALAVIARRQRQAIAQLFASHMSAELAQDLWKHRNVILRGEKPVPRRLCVTVLIADIAGSTRAGNALSPDRFMEWISRILDRLAEVARAHGGFVEKFTGDGILVVFGAPLPSEDPAAQTRDAKAACAAALAMAAEVDFLNADAGDSPAYGLRIGLNSGDALGGTIGVDGSMQYNVIGDPVNIAARVEGWSKGVLADRRDRSIICLTDRTATLAGDGFGMRAVGRMPHDAGTHDFQIYELLGQL